MSDKVTVVFTFNEPDSTLELMTTLGFLKEQFQEMPDVEVHIVNGRAAQYIHEFFQTGSEVKSPLVEHAKVELALLENDPEFNESIVKAVQAFINYGHSGGSASYAIPLLNDLLQGKNLSPLTNDIKEWMEVGPLVWQNRRNSEAFSEDIGKTYYLVSENPRVIYQTIAKEPISESEEEQKD